MIERKNEVRQGVIAAVLSAAALAGSLYTAKALDYRGVFIPGTVINGENASGHTVHEMEEIRVFAPNGQNAVFAVKITDNVQYGELYAPIHYIECNKLTPSIYDKYSREPDYKGGTCRFEKVKKEG